MNMCAGSPVERVAYGAYAGQAGVNRNTCNTLCADTREGTWGCRWFYPPPPKKRATSGSSEIDHCSVGLLRDLQMVRQIASQTLGLLGLTRPQNLAPGFAWSTAPSNPPSQRTAHPRSARRWTTGRSRNLSGRIPRRPTPPAPPASPKHSLRPSMHTATRWTCPRRWAHLRGRPPMWDAGLRDLPPSRASDRRPTLLVLRPAARGLPHRRTARLLPGRDHGSPFHQLLPVAALGPIWNDRRRVSGRAPLIGEQAHQIKTTTIAQTEACWCTTGIDTCVNREMVEMIGNVAC